MQSDADSVYYSRSTNNGDSWSGWFGLGPGKYPTVGLAQRPLGMPGNYYYLCVAYKSTTGTSDSLIFQYNDKWDDPGTGIWHPYTLSTNPGINGPPSLTTNWEIVYVTYPTVSPKSVICDTFWCCNPIGTLGRETIDSDTSSRQPCLAVDGNGYVYAAWKRGSMIYYAPRGQSPYWSSKVRVDWTTLASKQPFVECYGDSVFVVWADSMASPNYSFDVWRKARWLSGGPWVLTNVSYSSNLASESPTQAWREFTTWSEGTSSAQPDVWYYSPYWGKSQVHVNPTTWSYWPHSQMTNTMAGGAYLWSAWTESPTANQPPYTVLTKKTYFAPPPPPGGGDSFSGYYSVQAGQDTASPYCLKRDGVMRFAGKAVDFARDSLVYEFPYLDPQYDYFVKVASYRETGSNWAQALSVNGLTARSVQFAANRIDTVWIKIPPEAYRRDRKVVFVLKNVQGDYVTSLGLMLYQRDPLRGKGGPQSGGLAGQPAQEMFAVCPNPTKGEVQVEYSLMSPGKVSLSVFDITGRLIREIVDGRMPAGVYRAAWDGRDQAGRLSGSGVYFLRLSTSERTKTKRVVVVK
jgi:hypothetical protein